MLIVYPVTQVRAGDERAKTPGCFVATGSRDKSIRLWDALTGVCLRTFVSALLRTIGDDDVSRGLNLRTVTTTGFERSYFTLPANTSSPHPTTRPSEFGIFKLVVSSR